MSEVFIKERTKNSSEEREEEGKKEARKGIGISTNIGIFRMGKQAEETKNKVKIITEI